MEEYKESPKKAGKFITVKELIKSQGKVLGLKSVKGTSNFSRRIYSNEVNRPGLAIAGHTGQFKAERIQIIGQGEYTYCLREDKNEVYSNLLKMLSQNITPCVIITGGLRPLSVIRKACMEAVVPLLTAKADTAATIRELSTFLNERLAEIAYIHGVLVSVYGMGVLLRGDSGVGKSECALELLKRGHILIADDIVEVKRRTGFTLVGSSPKNIKHYMEVRGLGIIDVEMLFGVGAIMDEASIQMQVQLERVESGEPLSNYDRTGLNSEETKILGASLPSLRLPVTPGRNLAILIEVAALNQRLKNQGYSAAKKFNAALIKSMK